MIFEYPGSGVGASAVEAYPRDGGQLLKLKTRLSKSMTLTQFNHGYWYATELKEFAETLGIPFANKLRKDELETAIQDFLKTSKLKTGKIKSPVKRSLSTSAPKDVESGLRLDLPVVVYTSNKETKAFLHREAEKLAPDLKRKSGARYRLNRWREEQLVKGVKLTYGDLVKEYVRLNRTKEPFAQIPQDRYINFLSDYFAAEKGATREQAIKAWAQLKKLDIPKNYRAWAKSQSSKSR